jgi:hypothetical protein
MSSTRISGDGTSAEKPRSFGPSFVLEVVAIALAILALELAHGLGTRWFAWYLKDANPAIAEGRAWWSGRLDLPERLWDSALVAKTDKAYNVYPPLLSILAFVITAPIPGRDSAAAIPEFLPVVLFGLPVIFSGYWAFHRLCNGSASRPWWPAIMTLGWFGGTAMVAVTRLARDGDVNHLNHVVSQVGLLIMTAELLTKRRLRVVLAGLGIAAWTRQLTLLYLPAVLVFCWVSHGAAGEPTARTQRDARSALRRIVVTAVVGAVLAGVPMCLSWAKFGSPFESGYELIYAGRDDSLASDAQAHGLFSTAFLTRNAYHMNWDLPHWAWAGSYPRPFPTARGGSIWLGSPILALVWLGAPWWWRDPVRRALMLCSLLIILAHLLYHATGEVQVGYYRFSLDYVPVWIGVGAAWLTTGWRRWATLGCIAWSVTYFGMICG